MTLKILLEWIFGISGIFIIDLIIHKDFIFFIMILVFLSIPLIQ